MSQKWQEFIEETYAEDAAKLLEEKWQLSRPSNKVPDFIVNDGSSSFGLEITEVSKGSVDRKGGSISQRAEGKRQTLINTHRRKYEAQHKVPLSLKIVCPIEKHTGEQSLVNLTGEHLETIVQKLIEEDFRQRPLPYSIQFNINRKIKVWATKAFIADWKCLNDRVGWVSS